MLTIKIDIEQSTENLRLILDALQEFKVESTTWEEPAPEAKVDPKLRVSAREGDRAAALSDAINRATKERRGSI